MFGQSQSPIPPNLKFAFSKLTLAQDSDEIFLHYQGKSKVNQRMHSLRVLNIHSDFVKANYDTAVTLFIQELLRLTIPYPSSILIETFEVSNQTMGFACCPFNSLETQLGNSREIDIPKLIEDITSDMEFLWRNLKLRKFGDIISSKNIYSFEGGSRFFLGNWVKTIQNGALVNHEKLKTSDIIADSLNANSENQIANSQDLSEEIFALAATVLELSGTKRNSIEYLRGESPKSYQDAVKKAISKNNHLSKPIKQTLEKMLSLDVRKLPTLHEIKTIKDLEVVAPKRKINYPKKNEITTRAVEPFLDFQILKYRLDDFMKLKPESQRNILGEFLYPKVLRKTRPEWAPKITGMLVDFETLTVQDMFEFLEDDQILDVQIQAAETLLKEINWLGD